jgi:hypothetical protein
MGESSSNHLAIFFDPDPLFIQNLFAIFFDPDPIFIQNFLYFQFSFQNKTPFFQNVVGIKIVYVGVPEYFIFSETEKL